MGVNASKVKYQLDVDPSVTLRNAADGAETATATEAAISLKQLDTAYWHGKEIPNGNMVVVINVTALDKTTGDETYQLSLLVDDTANLSDNPVAVASIPVNAIGTYNVIVDSKSIPVLDPDASGTDKWMAIRATLGGTTPSISYGAWLAKSIRD